MVFTGFSHVRSCAHASKIDKKSFRTNFSSESRDGSLSERSFFELVSVKMVPEGSPERLERRLGTLLDALGALWGPSWALLGRSRALLGRSWGALGSLFFASASENSSREAPKSDFGRFWLDFVNFPRRNPPKSFREPAKSSRKPAPQRRAPNAEKPTRVRRSREANSV